MIWQGTAHQGNECHESVGTLKDGRKLHGWFYFVSGAPDFKPGFRPRKQQPDGTIWIPAEAANPDLPADINVYDSQMLYGATFSFADPAMSGLEPAMVKILLGIIYLQQGPDLLRQPGFDLLRACLTGCLDPRLHCVWLDASTEPILPQPCAPKYGDQLVWYECADSKAFVGGVRLHPAMTLAMTIDDFGCKLPGGVFLRSDLLEAAGR
jgi:hypothetical protein